MPASFPGAIKTFTTKADGDVILAAHVGDLQAEVTAIETAVGIYPGTAGAGNVQSLAGNKVLVDADYPIQSYSPTAARDVTLPALATTNHLFYILNRSATFTLTIKTPAAAVLCYIPPLGTQILLSDGSNQWATVGATWS